ncbi:MAG: hypothetical protein M3153_04930 [Chloroflexota bacterium]|nr:hypothetical protein [Chloroflexota bacterium]
MIDPAPLPKHVRRNREYWDQINAPRYAPHGRAAWATNDVSWRVFGVPDADLALS